MSNQPIISPSDHSGRGGWLDGYMPGGELVQHQPQPKLIDFGTVRGILYRQRWLVAGVVLAAGIIGLVVTLLATPMYEARSSVRVEPYGSFIVEGQDIEPLVPSNQLSSMLSTQIGIITSRALALTVAEDLNLAEDSGFLGENVDESRPPNLTDEQWRERKLSMAANKLHGGVSADFAGNNWIIDIAYRSADPVIAARMANAYAEAFVSMEMRDSLENNEYAKEYLEEQIGVTRQRLQEAEQAANEYARANGIIIQQMANEDGQGGTTLTTSNLADINARVAAAQAARIEAEQLWRSVQNLPPTQLAEVQNNSLLQGLIAQRTGAQAELAELRQRFYDSHPTTAAKIAQIETLESQIAATTADVRAGIRNAYVVASNRENALQAELSSLTGETLAEQDRRVDYGVLAREAQSLQDQLQALLARFNQISTASNVQSNQINLLDPAIVPSAPYSPNLLKNMIMALVLGVGLAGALAILRETLDDRIRSLDDVEERTGLKLLGHTPYVEERDMEAEEANRYGALMEAYASIRSTIDFSIPRDHAVLQLTSSQASEGKSTTSLILAELFAAIGRKTLLIDVDLRRPSIAALIDVERPKAGITEVLLGRADLQSAVIRGVHENLDILPVNERPSNPSELIASEQLKDFLEGCRREYSLVILDSCPVLGLADAPILSRLVDATVFVMEANTVTFSQVRAATRRLRATGGNPIGGIMTKYRSLQAGDSYNYQYAYYEYGSDDKTA